MARIIASYRRHQPVLIALSEKWPATTPKSVGGTYRELLTGIGEQFAAVIEAGQADGSIRATLSAAITASSLVWMVERVCQQNLPTQPSSYDDELAASLSQIIRGALYLEG